MKTVDITYRYEALGSLARARPQDGHAALERLNEGNTEFATLLGTMTDRGDIVQRIISVDAHDLGLLPGDPETPKQRPFAAILGCSDARVPIELIFNEGPNDLFVVRVAGNGLGSSVLGSLKYAVEHLGGSLKLVVVLGHSGCGALTAAVDVFLTPSNYLPLVTNHSLRHILDSLLVVVQASATVMVGAFGSDIVLHPRYRQALIEASIVTNAALAAFSIQEEIGAGDSNGLRAAYGVYLIETRQIWAPSVGKANAIGLAGIPQGTTGFYELGREIVRSERIASILAPV
jgi:carbonic anhydrase